MTKSTSGHRNGHLSVGVSPRNNGRKIDTWTFRADPVPGSDQKAREIMTFDVSLLSDLTFTVHTKDIPEERWSPLRGKSLDALHAEVEAICAKEFDLRNGLTWTDWLEVRVQAANKYDQRGQIGVAQAFLSYGVIPRGVTKDGRVLTVSGNGGLVKFPEPVGVAREEDGSIPVHRSRNNARAAEVLSGVGPKDENSLKTLLQLLGERDRRDPSTQFAYIPDTPVNRAGLDAIIAKIEAINNQLQTFLSHEQIDTVMQAIASGSGHPALPSPEVLSDATQDVSAEQAPKSLTRRSIKA